MHLMLKCAVAVEIVEAEKNGNNTIAEALSEIAKTNWCGGNKFTKKNLCLKL